MEKLYIIPNSGGDFIRYYLKIILIVFVVISGIIFFVIEKRNRKIVNTNNFDKNKELENKNIEEKN